MGKNDENLRLVFENGLEKLSEFSFCPANILSREPHEVNPLSGWIGLETWKIKTKDEFFWDVDWRYAFDTEIFKQHWIDFGWDEHKLLYRRKFKEPKRNKAIVYVYATEMVIPRTYSGIKNLDQCEDDKLSSNLIWYSIPEQYVLGNYWQNIYRGLVPLAEFPAELYELLPDSLPKTLDLPHGDFATTRSLQNTPSEIYNHPENEIQTVTVLAKHPKREGEGGLRTQGLYKHVGPDNDPLISIITVVLNNALKLEQTLQSVINHSKHRVEYIVVDGGSTDGTLEIIKKYDDQIDYWVSEPDLGIYNAMNKGLSLVNGNYVNFMNSGDCLFNLNCIIEGDIFCGGTIISYPQKCRILHPRELQSIKEDIITSHQSVLFSDSVYRKYLYNIQYRYASDYLLLLKLFFEKAQFSLSNNIISVVSSEGLADLNRLGVHLEFIKIHNDFNLSTFKRYYLICRHLILYPIKKIVSFFIYH
jgi:hypothetical protein